MFYMYSNFKRDTKQSAKYQEFICCEFFLPFFLQIYDCIYFLRPVNLYLGMYSTICMCLHSLFHMCHKRLQACFFKLIKPQLYGRKLGYVE